MQNDLLISVITGLVSGWVVVLFSDFYRECKERLFKIVGENAKFSRFVITILLPTMVLMIMWCMVLLVMVYSPFWNL